MLTIFEQLNFGTKKHVAPVRKQKVKEVKAGRPPQFIQRARMVCEFIEHKRKLESKRELTTHEFVEHFGILHDTMYRQLKRIQKAGYIWSEKISFPSENIQMRVWTVTEKGKELCAK
jgi:hypothetical protein